MKEKLMVRIFPNIREEGSLYGYTIETRIFSPDQLSPMNFDNFVVHLEENIPNVQELQELLPTINILDVTLDNSPYEHASINITIENEGSEIETIKDLIFEVIDKLEITKHSFDSPEIDECIENDIEIYVDITKEDIGIMRHIG